MIEQLKDFPPQVVAFVCSGHVSRRDYDTVLVPAVEAAFKQNEKLRLYYQINSDFTGVEPAAAWEDFKVGMAHWLRWERIAVVTDVDWIGNSIRAFGIFMPGVVKVFPLDQAAAAREWIADT